MFTWAGWLPMLSVLMVLLPLDQLVRLRVLVTLLRLRLGVTLLV